MERQDQLTTEEYAGEELVEMEDDLTSQPAPPSSERQEEAEVEPTPPFTTGRVVGVERASGTVEFEIELPNGDTTSDSVRWPEYDDPDEPLDRLLATVGLDRYQFADIKGEKVPLRPSGESHVIHLPPSRGIGNKMAHRCRRVWLAYGAGKVDKPPVLDTVSVIGFAFFAFLTVWLLIHGPDMDGAWRTVAFVVNIISAFAATGLSLFALPAIARVCGGAVEWIQTTFFPDEKYNR